MVILRAFLGIFLVVLVSCATTKKVDDVSKAQAHYKLGVSHLSSGNIQPAYVEFQTALQLDPKNKEIYNALGNVYLSLSDLQAAEEQFQKAIKRDPKYSDAHNNLCYTYYLLGQWHRAIASCKDALSNPLYVTAEKAYYNLGRIYYRKGDYDDAIKAYNESLKRMSGLHFAYYGIALSYNAKKQYGKAADFMMKGIKLDPAFRGDIEKAEKEFASRTGSEDEMVDYRDYIEILKY
jgi:type IV pilus biogenesis/stability protein PilW